RVVVIAIHPTAVANDALEAVDGEVHAAKLAGLVHPLDAMNREIALVSLVLGDEAGALDEHAARTASRVENAAAEGFEDLDEKADDAGRRIELAAALAFAHRELAEEVFVNPSEGIAFEIHRDGGEGLQ